MLKARALKVFIVVFWLVTTGLTIHQEVSRAREAKQAPITAEDLSKTDEVWLGIYFKPSPQASDKDLVKVGYSKLSREPLKDGWRYEERTRMKMNLMGKKRIVQTHTRATVDKSGRLKFFDFEMRSGPVQLLMWGQVRNNKLEVKIETGGSTQTLNIPFKDTPRIPLNLLEDIDLKSLKPGQTIVREVFDPTTMGLAEAKIIFLGTEPYRIGDKTITAYKFRQNILGVDVTSWLDENMITLREEAANLVTRRESAKYAVSEGWKKEDIDLIVFNAVVTKVNIPKPRHVKRMTIEVSGVDLSEFSIPDWRQKLTGSNTIEITRERTDDIKPFALGDQKATANFAEYLKPTSLIQSDHPTIRLRAKKIVGDRADALIAAKAINEWVYKNLEKEITVSIPSAVEVLELMRGDCNEHATLATALLRAAGIPAKILAGLVYQDGAFYYHAWVAAYVGKWIAMDPTFGLFPADAARIKLTEGDLSQMVKILQAVGRINIEVKEYESD